MHFFIYDFNIYMDFPFLVLLIRMDTHKILKDAKHQEAACKDKETYTSKLCILNGVKYMMMKTLVLTLVLQ